MRAVLCLLLLTAMLLAATTATAASWGVVGCSYSNSATVFSWDWEAEQFVFGEPISLAPSGSYPYDAVMRPRTEDEVWIPGASGDAVVVINEAGEILHEIPCGEYPVSVAFSPNYDIALVSCRDSDRVDIIDINTYTVTGSLDIPSGDPGNIIFDPRGDRFFLVEWYGDFLFEIAPDGSSVMDQASVGSSLWQLAIDPMMDGPLFLTDRGTDQVRVIDPETLQEIRAVDVGDDPWGIDVDDTQVVVCCEDSHDVYHIDSYDWTVTQFSLAADADPRDVSICTGIATIGGKTLLGAAAYVCGGQTSAGNLLYVLDIYDLTLLDTLTVPCTNTNVVTVEAQWPLPSPVNELPGASALELKASPNPFNPRTTISFVLDEAVAVKLAVFDLNGHLVRRIDAGTMGSGPRSIEWDGADRRGRKSASGTYLVVVQAGERLAETKVVLVQ